MTVGGFGTGQFNQTGGTVNMGANPLALGNSSGGSGTYTMNNAAAALNSRTARLVGFGTSTFTQSAGTHTVGTSGNGFLEFGSTNSSGTATYALSGGTLQVNGNLNMGVLNTGGFTGTMNHTGGSNTVTGLMSLTGGATTNVSYNLSGAGTLAQTGAGSVLSLAGAGLTGFSQGPGTTYTSTGSVQINPTATGQATYLQTGGTAAVTSFSVQNLSQGGTTNVSIQGGTLNAGVLGIESVGDSTFIVGGAGTGVNAASLSVGRTNGASSGVASFNHGGGSVTVTGPLAVGSTLGATYTLGGAGVLKSTTMSLGMFSGSGTGTFQQNGGTVTLTSGFMQLGVAGGSTGRYNLVSGTLAGGPGQPIAANLGTDGAGEFVQSGGTSTFSNLRAGFGTVGTGAITLTGGSMTTSTTNVGGAGAGQFTQDGGTHDVSTLIVGRVGGVSGIYRLRGTGVLNSFNVNVGGASASFEQSAGAHTVTGQLTVGATGSYTLSGGTLTVPGAGGSLTNHGFLAMSGGALNGAVTNIGTLSYSGGTYNGSLVNNGSVSLSASLAVGGGMLNNSSVGIGTGVALSAGSGQTLDNSGTVTLYGGTLGGAGATVNNATVNGYGTIGGAGGFTNNALITGSGGNMVFTGAAAVNNGNLTVATGLQAQLNGGGLTNNGTISLNSGAVTGPGTLTNAAGGNLVGPGLVSAPLVNNGGMQVSAGTMNISGAWTNAGVATLGGLTASLAGGAVTNTGTIQGFGNVGAAVNNASGGTIEAVGGTLRFATVTNAAGGLITAGAGAKVVATSGLAANNGVISLNGGTFDNNGQAMTNNGQISGNGTVRTGAAGLTNAGSVSFAGGNSTVNGPVTNNAGKTIRVTGSTATFTGNVVNNGIVKNTGGVIIFAGTYTENGTYVSDPAANYFNDVSIGTNGAWVGGQGDQFFLSGDLQSTSIVTMSWDTADAELIFSGGDGSHDLSITGLDRGERLAGFAANFAWGRVSLGQGESLNLTDSGAPGGALYVRELALGGGLAQVGAISGNGLNLYYDPAAAANAYLGGGRFGLAGGGFLAPVPEPGSALLSLSAAGALAARRRRSRAA